MIQVDGVGLATSPTQAHVMGWPPEQKADVMRVLRAFPRCVSDDHIEMGSDHVPFYLHGVPAIAFIGEYHTVPIHTDADTMDLMSPDELAFTAEVAAALVGHLTCRSAD